MQSVHKGQIEINDQRDQITDKGIIKKSDKQIVV